MRPTCFVNNRWKFVYKLFKKQQKIEHGLE
jgi:hypothetical protein